MEIISRYRSCLLKEEPRCQTIARVMFNNMNKHAYMPTTINSDKKSTFVSQVIKELAEILEATLQHGKTKHAQTFEKVERKHASKKKALKSEKGERRSMCLIYVNIAVLNYNRSCPTNIGCELSLAIHERIAFNLGHMKFDLSSTEATRRELLEQTLTIEGDVGKII